MPFKPFVSIVVGALWAMSPVVSWADSLAGSYLSGNHANVTNDYTSAANFYSKALLKDPKDPFLLQNTLLSYVIVGELGRAKSLADSVSELGLDSQLSDLVKIAAFSNAKEYDAVLEILETSKERLSPLLVGLIKGWALIGQGKTKAGIAAFEDMKKPDALQLFGQYHKAMALALKGDFKAANDLFVGDGKRNLRLDRGGIIAHIQILSQLGDFDKANEILGDSFGDTDDPELQNLIVKIAEKEAIPFSHITTPNDGISTAFYTLASVLIGSEDERFSLVYARLSEQIRPDNIQAILLLSELLREQKQHDLATEILAKIPADHALFLNAELGRADTLLDAGEAQAAIAVLQGLVRSHPNVAQVQMVLGDVYNSEKQYREANKAYSGAVVLVEKSKRTQWYLYYARAISFERLNEWDNAEADFRKALELSPEQPSVLNYLGYSLVEKNIKLAEAQDMIERAVKARPNDGFITDSLAWVLYRLGKFQQAVAPMERAVELVPTDPVLNDHLGDVYWSVGREREAAFQWKRSLSFKPEEKDAARIRHKLDVGLDAVLTEEKAKVSDAN